jgi:hypothetical protein
MSAHGASFMKEFQRAPRLVRAMLKHTSAVTVLSDEVRASVLSLGSTTVYMLPNPARLRPEQPSSMARASAEVPPRPATKGSSLDPPRLVTLEIRSDHGPTTRCSPPGGEAQLRRQLAERANRLLRSAHLEVDDLHAVPAPASAGAIGADDDRLASVASLGQIEELPAVPAATTK